MVVFMPIKIKCNCPDSTNRRGSIAIAQSFSNQIASNWSDGFNGIKAQSPPGYCKHEMKVIMELGLAESMLNITDLPTAPVPKYKPKDTRPVMQRDRRMGDNFGGRDLFF